jgi:putative exosortase-associated protein (TIGR04073 family)
MAKKLILAALIFLFVLNMAAPAYCGDSVKKLGRGFCNIFTCVFELPLQMSRINNADGPMAAGSWGLLKGLGMTCVRLTVGLYEVVTFPIPFPKKYSPILTDPEFFFEQENW